MSRHYLARQLLTLATVAFLTWLALSNVGVIFSAMWWLSVGIHRYFGVLMFIIVAGAFIAAVTCDFKEGPYYPSESEES